MQAQAFLDRRRLDPEEADRLVHVEDLPARTVEPAPFGDDVPEVLVSRLGLLGIRGLYAHQQAGLDTLAAGRHVLLATGTASGKSLVYQIAAAEAALTTPKATALFLFPTKALARDQLRAIRALKLPQLKAAVYDGDTPKDERPLIRRNANLVLTNPDMLHASVLADHARWARLPAAAVARGGRRGARVARCVRLAGGDGAAAAPPADTPCTAAPRSGAWRAPPSGTPPSSPSASPVSRST